MRLHRLTLENLNSLRGEHTIDFDASLGDAPLFLIHGPTGAGKSTLMDAISLALFGRTPRLKDANVARGQSGVIGADDGRQIMTRGTGSCSATLVFSRVEGSRRRYFRAYWGCNRARGRADGAVQGVARELMELAGPTSEELLEGGIQGAGKNKKDWRDAFDEALVGMEADDFYRSMLLAQGEFARFLSAKEAERASILERITETSQYSELGARAADRNRAEQQRVSELQSELRGATVFGETERATVERERDEARGAEEEEGRALAPIDAALGWLNEARRLQAERVLAVEAADSSASALARLSGDAERLASHRRAASANDALDRLATVWGEGEVLELELASVVEQRAALAPRVESARVELAHAVAAEEAARGARRSAEPELARARAVWGELRELARALEEATVQRDGRRQRFGVLTNEQGECTAELEAAGELARSLGDEWESRAEWHALVEDDGALVQADARVSEVVGAVGAWREAVVAFEAIVAELGDVERGLGVSRSSIEALESAHDAAVAAYAEADAGRRECCLDGETATVARRRFDEASVALRARSSKLDDARRGLDQRDAALVEAAKLESDAVRRESDAVAGEEQMAALERQRGEVAEHVETAERLAETALLATELVHLRERLVDGEPCPVCESTAHPVRQRSTSDANNLEEAANVARERVAELRGRVETLGKEIAALGARVQGARERAAELRASEERQREVAVSAERAARASWEAAGGDDEPTVSAVGVASAAVAESLAAVEEGARRLALADAAVAAASEELERARLARDAAATGVREGQARVRALEERRDALRAACGVAEERVAERVRAFVACVRALPNIEGEAGLDEAPDFDAVAAQARRWVDEVRRELQATRELSRRLVAARAAEEAARSRVDAAVAAAESAKRDVDEAEERVATLEGQRAAAEATTLGLFEGRDPVAVAAALEGDIERARERNEAARGVLLPLESEQDQLEGRVKELKRRRVELGARTEKAVEVADAALAAIGMSSDEARSARLAEDEAAEIAAAIQGAEARLAAAVATVERSTRVWEAHRSGVAAGLEERAIDWLRRARFGEGDAAELGEVGADGTDGVWRVPVLEGLTASLTEEREASQARRQEHRDRRIEREALLQDDDQRRARLAEAHARLDAARERARVWETLHQLIGVGDGERFQKFAQSLNLQQILVGANHHLLRLKPRYRLVQDVDANGVPSLDFAIEDAHHAGEVRPLTTLSGGETFLCSLGLALGLAGLRRNRLPIETLLLDEGFGTLDRESLDGAIDVLEQLHHEGYRVGLISHVETLQERIPAQVEVRPIGGGASEIIVRGDVG